MNEPDEYGNSQIYVGFSHDVSGVALWVKDPETGMVMKVFTVDPEFARQIAMNLTLESFACDEDRRDEKSSGG